METDMTDAMAPAGWYPDSQIPNTLRWWDGQQWTQNTAPAQASSAPASAPQVPDRAAPSSPELVLASSPPPESRHRAGLFGGKRELEDEVARLNQELAALGVPERNQLRSELIELRSQIPALSHERDELMAVVGPLRLEVADLQTKQQELTALRSEIQSLQQQKSSLDAEFVQLQGLTQQIGEARAEYEELARQVVETRETAILQEVGIYQYRHPLDDAPAYKARLTGISAQIKDSARAGTAVQGSTNWTVNGSAREGARMVKEFSKLMLRAYNNEADNAVRSMKPYTLDSSIARLTKARETIVKLGGTMNIRVTDGYHKLRVEELELTADYLAKMAEQKEKDREERARLKEEEIARREFEREQDRLRKEQAHYESTLAMMRAQGDEAAAADLETKLNEIGDALDGLNRRSANIRAGHVYVISNVGAFGPDMVKIGMTRRLDPMDRVKELGDASVPFHYDVHALIFSDDAVGLETSLHHALADSRVNFVNMRREFFRVHPRTVKDMLDGFGATVVEYVEQPEAVEWNQSENHRRELLAQHG
jgi:seryl-tRNA synthetase